jgi:hypothetical protein
MWSLLDSTTTPRSLHAEADGNRTRPARLTAAAVLKFGAGRVAGCYPACSIEEAVATEYSADEMPVYRRWKPSSADTTGG